MKSKRLWLIDVTARRRAEVTGCLLAAIGRIFERRNCEQGPARYCERAGTRGLSKSSVLRRGNDLSFANNPSGPKLTLRRVHSDGEDRRVPGFGQSTHAS
jgi:hypothetical protein